MAEFSLRLDSALVHLPGPVPADLAEGLATDGTPLVLQPDAMPASFSPSSHAPAPVFEWDAVSTSMQSVLTDIVSLLPWFFLFYFIVSNSSLILFNLMSLFNLLRCRREQRGNVPARDDFSDELPVSLIVPACNQAGAIVPALRALLRLDYSEFEIIVVNDGSDDGTLEKLVDEFSLVPFPEAYRDRLQTAPIKSIYASSAHPRLRLVDKVHGGMSEALNAGINCSRYPLFCAVDVAYVLQRDSLRRMSRAFVGNPAAMATCSIVRAADGRELKHGLVGETGLPRNIFILFRMAAGLRAVLPGWKKCSDLDARHVTHDALFVFRKEVVVAAGAYRSDVAAAGVELAVRIQGLRRQAKEACRMVLVPGAVCGKAAPETLCALEDRGVGKQRGQFKSLDVGQFPLFGRQGGAAFPLWPFGWPGPLVELLGYVVMTVLWLAGKLEFQAFSAFMLAAVGMGLLSSVSGLVAEDVSFRYYPSLGSVLKLFAAALLENSGMRQMAALRRLAGRRRRILRNDAK